MVDIIVVAFVVLCFIGIRKKVGAAEVFSTGESGAVKGILCVCIIMHHLALQTSSGVVFRYFTLIGYLAVALFFFFSGYGLSKKYEKDGEKYLDGFLISRFKKVFLPFAAVFVLSFIVCFFALGTTPSDVLSSFLRFDPFPYHSWYIWAAMLTYLLFRIGYGCFKNKRNSVIFVFICCAVLSVACHLLGRLDNLSVSIMCFALGLAISSKENVIIKKCREKRVFPLMLIVFALLFAGACAANFLLKIRGTAELLGFAVRTLSSFFLCMFILVFFTRFTIKSPVFSFIGKYSFEIYMLHGVVYKLLQKVSFIKSETVYVLCSVVLSVAAGVLFALLYRKSVQTITRLTRKKT